MGRVRDRRSGWAGRARQLAATRWSLAVAGGLLALSAMAQVSLRLAAPGGEGSQGTQMAQARPVAQPGTAGPGLHELAQHAIHNLNTLSPQGTVAVYALCLATTLPLALRRPVTAAVTVTVASALALLLSVTVAPAGVAALYGLTAAGAVATVIAIYRLGRSGPLTPAVVLAVPFPVLALAGAATGEARVLAIALASLAPAAALAGIARQARSEALASSAARQAVTGSLLEHTARGERARIARELHDVVAHHISMVAVQAETARLATPGMPDAGAQRLLAIGDTARAALTEMRRLLGVLREDAQAAAPGLPVADRQPQPGLRELNKLLDEARDASGVGTRLILEGSPVPLDPGVELAAYRIIQEALTNSRRHAPGAAVDVELHYSGDGLRVVIRDNGPGPLPGPVAGGHGLPGMRERAVAVGGELRTGPAPGGGFLVTANLPGKGSE